MRKLLSILISVTPLVIMAACAYLPTVFYSHFVPFPSEGIPVDWQFTFSPADSIDSISRKTPVDVIVAMRYSGDCRTRRIELNVEEINLNNESPDSSVLVFDLFTNEGRPLGRGGYALYEITDTLHHNFVIPPGYCISISSSMPEEATQGIKTIGVVAGNPPLKKIQDFF